MLSSLNISVLTNTPTSFYSLCKFIQIKCKWCGNFVPKVLFSCRQELMQFLSDNGLCSLYMNSKQRWTLFLTPWRFAWKQKQACLKIRLKRTLRTQSWSLKMTSYLQVSSATPSCHPSCQLYKTRCWQLILRILFISFQNTKSSTSEGGILTWNDKNNIHSLQALTAWECFLGKQLKQPLYLMQV